MDGNVDDRPVVIIRLSSVLDHDLSGPAQVMAGKQPPVLNYYQRLSFRAERRMILFTE